MELREKIEEWELKLLMELYHQVRGTTFHQLPGDAQETVEHLNDFHKEIKRRNMSTGDIIAGLERKVDALLKFHQIDVRQFDE